MLRGISIQLQDIQSTVQKCLQEVSRAGRVHDSESGGVRSADVQVTGEMAERGTAILQGAQSSLETFLSLLQPQKVQVSLMQIQLSLFDANLASYLCSIPESCS